MRILHTLFIFNIWSALLQTLVVKSNKFVFLLAYSQICYYFCI